jgi:hypothetical protein
MARGYTLSRLAQPAGRAESRACSESSDWSGTRGVGRSGLDRVDSVLGRRWRQRDETSRDADGTWTGLEQGVES